ncbi:MAG TPA: helix-turn-helix transcriptional regulator [Pseudogracilibacillus sp.]|nr:helix-turn-helix transcriptional regulator [Pseudogracilibacillus sp.]
MENRIRSLRQTKQMTQQDLANEVQVSRQSIVAIEKGKYNPSLELAFKISRVFQASIEEVFIFNE